MAAKVNVKFIGIVLGALGVAVVILVVLGVLQYRMDATRNIRTGDAAMESGDYRIAKVAYGRAVNKEQTNQEYLRKFEAAILAHRPETREEAREWYEDWLRVLAVDAMYRGSDPDTHKRLIHELIRRGKLIDNDAVWQQVQSAADQMWDVVAEDDPERILAKLYRGIAIGRRVSVLSTDEIEEGEEDLKAVLEVRPESDAAWATLTMMQLATAERYRAESRTAQYEAKVKELLETRDKGVQAVPDGFEMAMADARVTAYQRATGTADVTQADIDDKIDHIVDLAETTEDTLLLLQYIQLMRELNSEEAIGAAVELLRSRVEDDEEAIFEHLGVARAYLLVSKLDEAQQFARKVIDAPRLTTSLVSQAQHDLRREAARMLVDVAVRRWDTASPADKPEMLKRVDEARAELVNFTSDPSDPLLLWADGRIALIHADYETAAAKLEEYLRLRPDADLETLMLSAKALEEIKQYGVALNRVRRVAEAVPGNVQILAQLARLQYNVGRPNDARATLEQAERIAKDHPAVVNVRQAIDLRSRDGSAEDALSANEQANPLLVKAREAIEANDTETARELLRQAAEAAPDDLITLKLWFNFEVAAGDLDAAREIAKRAQALAPNDLDVKRVATLLSHDDPIAGIKEYIASTNENEDERLVATMVNLRALAGQQSALAENAERVGNEEDAKKARDLAERATAEADALVARAEEVAPNNRTLIEHQFIRATVDGRWEEAQRIVDRAESADADRVGGRLYRGRLAMARGRYEDAIRAFMQATERLSYSAYAWRLLGMAYEGAGNIADARRAYQRSYDCNPNDLATLRLYCGLLVRIGDPFRAMTLLRSAANLLPDNSPAVEYWLSLEAEHGDVGLVLTRRRDIYERNSKNQTNALRLAALLGQLKPSRELILDANGKPRYAGNRWDRMPISEQRRLLDESRESWLKESEAILADLEQQGVRGMAIVNVRARNALARNNAEQGEQQLRDFLAEQERAGTLTVQHQLALGQYLAEAQQYEEARDVFVAARALQDPKVREADLMLGDLYFRGGRNEQAAEVYQQVYDSTDVSNTTAQRLVECYIKTREFDKAAAVLDDIRDKSSSDYVTAMLEAAIAEGRGQDLLAEGEEDAARQEFEKQGQALDRATTLAPSQPMPHVQRAISYLAQFGREKESALLDRALGALDTAAAMRADFAPISITRADVLIAQGKLDAAIGELGRLLEQAPDSLAVRRRLIELLLNSGRMNEAGNVLLDATKRFPDTAIWFERYGDLKVAQGDVNAAEPMYTKAYAIERTLTLLAKVATARLRMTPPNPRGAAEFLGANQAEVEADPALRGIFAEALSGMGRQMDALNQMRASHRQFREEIEKGEIPPEQISQWYVQLRKIFKPNQIEAAEQFIREVAGERAGVYDLQWIARFWADGGQDGLRKAIEIQRQAIDACPPANNDLHVGLLNDLALYYLRLDDYPNAIEVMEQVITLQPDNAMAFNNLAYLMGERAHDIKKALSYAEKANTLKPDDPNILDTLGFLYMLDEQYDKAENHLRQSERIFPMASTYVHLARLMLLRGEPRFRVETAIRRAEELNPDAKTREEINRLLDDMRKASP